MAYADYDFYADTYMGVLIQRIDWDRYSTQASYWIDYYTRDKAADYVDAHPDDQSVALCCCAVAEVYQQIANVQASLQAAASSASVNGTSGLESEHVGSYSVSYRSGASEAANATAALKALRESVAGVAVRYLANAGLLYRGGRRGSGGWA